MFNVYNRMKKRYFLLDSLRGITLISMMVYHAVWDLVYIFGVKMPWYQSKWAFVWQQSICWTFILLSGFCWSLGGKKRKRALQVAGASVLISAVTLIFMPENRVLFGVLSAIGTGMFLMIPLDKVFRRINPYLGILAGFGIFIITREVNAGYLGFGSWRLWELPKEWYANLFTAYLGFPAADFWSTDYFSVIPWLFLYWTGYFLYIILEQMDFMKHLTGFRIKPLEVLGRHSLEIYMLHQPVIYGVLYLVFRLVD